MGIFSKLFGRKPEPEAAAEPVAAPKEPKAETAKTSYKVAGISFRRDAVLRLAEENPDWALSKSQMIRKRLETVYRYQFRIQQAELVPEPDNPEDPKSIKVIMDGEHIGYIKSGNCARILNLMEAGAIVSISGQITGGPWKGFPDFAGDIDDPDDRNDLKDYDLQVFPDAEFGAKVTIVKRN